MRVILKLGLMILIAFSCFGATRGQFNQVANQQDEHIRQVIRTLSKDNELRLALEDGYRSDGIHYTWMDDMRKFGIKHVSYAFRFVWDQGVLRVDISESFYFRQYYNYDRAITNAEALWQIVASGLKDKLEVEARLRANREIQSLIMEFEPRVSACGTSYQNLLDDEALPILNGMSHIVVDSDCTPKKVYLERRTRFLGCSAVTIQ